MADKLHIGHRERLRQRLMTYGADALCEHELLELMLFYPLPRINTNEIAHSLINEFGTLNNILNADVDELTRVKGVGASAAEFIRLAAEMCGDYEASAPEFDRLPDSDSLCSFFHGYFGEGTDGLCLIVCLSSDLGITGKVSFTAHCLANGRSELRRIASIILRGNCTRIALGISHPDRAPVPDRDDFALLRTLSEKLGAIGVAVEDCVICGKESAFSMKRSGAFSFGEVTT
ncbi:DNA repair protein RadC [Ruminococcus sp. YRD2003]|uniref:UPF0758 domain-containing protein n=1 Tax=Ruminococcus sp. YRD2003 TaxID=1452313 RepID=UPI0008D346B5|nr:DNA repair protein RadC [Ruminococcus flavefaciens]